MWLAYRGSKFFRVGPNNSEKNVFHGEAILELNVHYHLIGAGTGPAGPAMAGPFSAEVET